MNNASILVINFSFVHISSFHLVHNAQIVSKQIGSTRFFSIISVVRVLFCNLYNDKGDVIKR